MRMLWIKAGAYDLAPWGFVPDGWIHWNWDMRDPFYVHRFPIPMDRRDLVRPITVDDAMELQYHAFGLSCRWEFRVGFGEPRFVLVEGFEALAKHSEVATFPTYRNGRGS